jgi:hypothetical protein
MPSLRAITSPGPRRIDGEEQSRQRGHEEAALTKSDQSDEAGERGGGGETVHEHSLGRRGERHRTDAHRQEEARLSSERELPGEGGDSGAGQGKNQGTIGFSSDGPGSHRRRRGTDG